MSSNIKAKNIIYSLKKYDTLPYQNSQMIDYSSNNQYVNSVHLNNTYGQCVDNDLFIAKQLKKSIDSSLQAGPMLVTSTAEINALPDGAKIFASEYDARIMQKHVESLQNSLKKCNNSLFLDVNFVQLIAQNTALVCTSEASYLAFLDEINDTSNFSPSILVKDMYGKNVVVTAIVRNEEYEGNIFAATVYGSNSFGLYNLKSNSTSFPSKDYMFKLVSQTINDKIISISYDKNTGLLACATSTTLYICTGDISSSVSMSPIATFSTALGTGDISTINLADSYVLVLTTSGRIYHVNAALSTSIGFAHPSISQISQDSIVVHDIAQVNNIQYFATSKGLCRMNGNTLHVIDAQYSSETKHVEVDSNGILWFVDSQNRILSYTPEKTILEYEYDATPEMGSFTCIHIVCGIKVISTDNGIWYEKCKRVFDRLSLTNVSMPLHLIVQSQADSVAYAYIIGKNDIENLTIAKVKIDRNTIGYNYASVSDIATVSAFSSLNAYIVSLMNIGEKSFAFANTSTGSLMYSIDDQRTVFRWNSQIRGTIKHPNENYIYILFDSFAVILKHNGNAFTSTTFSIDFAGKTIIDSQHTSQYDTWVFSDAKVIGQPSFDTILAKWTLSYYNDAEDPITLTATNSTLSDAIYLVFKNEGNDVIGQLQTQFIVTLSNDINDTTPMLSSYQLARMLLYDNAIYLKEAVSLGISSNIVPYEVDNEIKYLAIEKDDFVHAQLFDFSTKMSLYDNIENESLQSVVSLSSPQIIDNIYQYLHNESDDSNYTYRRSDYIVPATDNNISVIRSTCTYDVDSNSFSIDANEQVMQEIPDTSGIKSISHRYNTTYGINHTTDMICFISSDNSSSTSAIYVSNNSIEHSYVNPEYLFTCIPNNESCIIQPNIKQAVLDTECLLSGNSQYNFAFSSIEIDDTNELCSHTYYVSNGMAHHKYFSIGIDNNLTPIRLAKSSHAIYALCKDNNNNINKQYKIYELLPKQSNVLDQISVIPSILCTLTCEFEPISFMYTYNDIDAYQPYHDYRHAFALSSSNFGGILHVICKDADYTLPYKLDGTYGNLTSLKWDSNYKVSMALATHQTPNTFANLMFANAMFNTGDVSALFYLDGQQGLYQVDAEKTISRYVDDNALCIDWVKKDLQLSSIMTMQGNSLSIQYYNANVLSSIVVQMPDESSKPQLMQCYNRPFYEQQNILFSNKYSTKISSISHINNELIFNEQILLSTSISNANVLNRTNNLSTFPIISQLSTLGIIDYDTEISLSIDESENSISFLSVGQKYGVIRYALNANDSDEIYIANKPIYSSMTLYNATFGEQPKISAIASFNGLVDNMLFPNNFCKLAYSLANGSDATRLALNALDIDDNVVDISSSSYLEEIIASSTLGYLAYDNLSYTLYGSTSKFGSFALRFLGIRNINKSLKSAAQLDGIASNIIRMPNEEYAIQSTHNILKYDYLEQNIENAYSSVNTFGMLSKSNNNGHAIYYASDGNEIISSYDLYNWDHIAYIGISSEYDSLVTTFQMFNSYVMMCNKKNSNNNGLFYTQYRYSLIDNTSPFTAESAFYMYNDNISAIDEQNAQYMIMHIDSYHSHNSNVSLLNDYMDTSFSLSNFIKVNDSYDVQNDYIDKILFGNSDDDSILAYATNSANGKQQKKIRCNYIAKCWKSGFTELYIYLPTTYTYYVPHVEGASQCKQNIHSVTVNGRKLTANVYDNTTMIRVNIINTLFSIGSLLENTIKANSLPLQIYKDDMHDDISSDALFHSFVCPSIAQEFSKDDEMWGYQTLNYYCFGSDAQAIKLSFINSSQTYNKKYKTIVYHVNGGFLPEFSEMKSLKQRIYEGDTPTNIYWDIFQKNGAFFAGWSQFSNATNGDDTYNESFTVSYDSLSYQTLNLYACWISYEFGENDTQITISNVIPKNYTIAEITIDPNIKLQDNTSLGNTMIIDYGD